MQWDVKFIKKKEKRIHDACFHNEDTQQVCVLLLDVSHIAHNLAGLLRAKESCGSSACARILGDIAPPPQIFRYFCTSATPSGAASQGVAHLVPSLQTAIFKLLALLASSRNSCRVSRFLSPQGPLSGLRGHLLFHCRQFLDDSAPNRNSRLNDFCHSWLITR